MSVFAVFVIAFLGFVFIALALELGRFINKNNKLSGEVAVLTNEVSVLKNQNSFLENINKEQLSRFELLQKEYLQMVEAAHDRAAALSLEVIRLNKERVESALAETEIKELHWRSIDEPFEPQL